MSPLAAATPERLAHDILRTTFASGLTYYDKLTHRNWKNTVALGPAVDCLHCEFPKDLEARKQSIWLAATPGGRAFLLAEYKFLVGLHCFRIAGDSTPSANVVVAPALWPQLFGSPKPTQLEFTPGLTHSYLLCWPKDQLQPNPPLPDDEAAAALWAHAEADHADALSFLRAVAADAAVHTVPEELVNGVLTLVGPDGYHTVIAGKLGTSFELTPNGLVRATQQQNLPSGPDWSLIIGN